MNPSNRNSACPSARRGRLSWLETSSTASQGILPDPHALSCALMPFRALLARRSILLQQKLSACQTSGALSGARAWSDILRKQISLDIKQSSRRGCVRVRQNLLPPLALRSISKCSSERPTDPKPSTRNPERSEERPGCLSLKYSSPALGNGFD